MGGQIVLCLRRADSSVEIAGVWTNNLKNKFWNADFMERGDVSLVSEYIRRYLDCDPEEVAGFGGPTGVVPGEYGFVYVDEVNKTVHNYNSYCRLGHATDVGLGLGYDELKDTEVVRDDEYYVEERNFLVPKIKNVVFWPKRGEVSRVTLNVEDVAGVDDFVRRYYFDVVRGASRSKSIRFTLDFGDWEVVDGSNNDRDIEELKRLLVGHGVLTSPEDLAEWEATNE